MRPAPADPSPSLHSLPHRPIRPVPPPPRTSTPPNPRRPPRRAAPLEMRLGSGRPRRGALEAMVLGGEDVGAAARARPVARTHLAAAPARATTWSARSRVNHCDGGEYRVSVNIEYLLMRRDVW